MAAALLATRLAAGRLASPFTAREVYRQEWIDRVDVDARLGGHDRARLAQATLLSNGASSAEALALLAHKSVSFQP